MRELQLEVACWGAMVTANVWFAVGNTAVGIFYLVVAIAVFIKQHRM